MAILHLLVPLVLLGGFVVVGLVVLVIVQSSRSAPAVVVRARVVGVPPLGGGQGGPRSQPVVTYYAPDGRALTVQVQAAVPQHLEVGQEVNVVLDSRDPSRARLA